MANFCWCNFKDKEFSSIASFVRVVFMVGDKVLRLMLGDEHRVVNLLGVCFFSGRRVFIPVPGPQYYLRNIDCRRKADRFISSLSGGVFTKLVNAGIL